MDDGIKGLGRRSALGLVGAVVSGVCTIATLLVATRTLSRDEAGEFFVAISLFAIVQGICSFGAETGLQFHVPTMTNRDAKRLIRSVCSVSAVAGLVAATIVWFAAGPFGDLLSRGESSGGEQPNTVRIIHAVAVLLPFAGLYDVTMGALRACDQVLRAVALDRIARPLAQVAAMLVAAATHGGSRAALVAWALPNVAALAIAAVLLVRARVRGAAADTVQVSLRTFWTYTAPRSVARIAQALTQRLDVIILAAVYPIADAAVYGTVSRCMIAGVMIATAVNQAVQPQLRRLIVRGDRSAVKNMYETTTAWLVLVQWPPYLAMMAFAPLVLSAFGADYERGATALMLLCSAMLVSAACGTVDVVLLMLGRSWLSAINVVTALGLNVVLNLLLAPRYGMNGSAIAWVVAILTTNLVPLLQTSRLGLHPGGVPLVTASLTAAATIGAPLAAARLLFGPDLITFVVAVPLALGLYAFALTTVRDRVKLDRLIDDLRRPRQLATQG